MNKKISRIIMFILTIITVVLLFLFLKNQIFEILKLARDNDKKAIEDIIKNRGIVGLLLIVIIEAIQMIVVIIPAEFIQLSAGISYPFYIAILLCLLGVFIGASTIYLLVNYLKFDRSIFKRSHKKISVMLKDKKESFTMQVLMYLLFITPVIPFGAICYFGSSSKMSYRRYILTCTTGVIPSIVTSIIMGNAIVYFTSIGAPIWLLILIIVLLAAILFGIIMLIIRKLYFKNNQNSPNTLFYEFYYNLFKLYIQRKVKVKIDNDDIFELDGPILILSNHQSYFDFYYACHFAYPLKAIVVGNRYYFRFKFLKHILRNLKSIPKSLFYPDVETIKEIMKSTKNNQNIIMFPEGRLSADGSSYNIVDGIGSLIKKINVNVAVININGAFYSKSKWGKKFNRGKVTVSMRKIFKKEELVDMDAHELENKINQLIKTNENEFILKNDINYKYKNKALGMDNQLYYCPHCQSLYTIVANNNSLECNNCHYKVEIENNYQFKEISNYLNNSVKNLIYWNRLQYNFEKEYINNKSDYLLSCDCDVKNINMNNKKNDLIGKGRCTLSAKDFSFVGEINNNKLEFIIPITKLKALAYSCNEEFECYYENNLYYFYPVLNKKEVVRWAMIVDILYERYLKNENK